MCNIKEIKEWTLVNENDESAGFVCECGCISQRASNFCPDCGSQMKYNLESPANKTGMTIPYGIGKRIIRFPFLRLPKKVREELIEYHAPHDINGRITEKTKDIVIICEAMIGK